jgi:predicted dehydrogenase
VVHVCIQPDTHADLAVRALSARAAVLVEKPLALSRAETTLIASTLRGASRCPLHRPQLPLRALHADRSGWVNAGRIGHVLAADVFYGVDPLPGEAGPGVWAHGCRAAASRTCSLTRSTSRATS